jgi:hypothetical protein
MSDILTERQQEGDLPEESERSGVVKSLLLLALLLVGLLLNAYFLLLLWHWFIVPLGVREITFWHSAGLSAMLSYFRSSWGKPRDKEKQNFQDWRRRIRVGFGEMACYFVIAWLFHHLMARS